MLTFNWSGEGEEMKKGINIVLEDEQIVELIRILIDNDADDALKFLKVHFKGKARELLEGG
jgi:hypothetical protein